MFKSTSVNYNFYMEPAVQIGKWIAIKIITKYCYCMFMKTSPILYSKLIYEIGPDFLDIQYVSHLTTTTRTNYNNQRDKTHRNMGLILDGNSEHVAHA